MATPQAPNFAVDQGFEYYAGKPELLDWINRLLDLNLMRLEQLTSGAVFCQILDAFHADIVLIRKVNFAARETYEILPNYKVLQAAFTTLGITKELDVARLSQGNASELMEFTQWLYKTYKCVAGLPDYRPTNRRNLAGKGATNNIPFPACLTNGSFDFGRAGSEMRTSGAWAGGTPNEILKTLPRVQQPPSTRTPSHSRPPAATAAGSSTKRSMPNLNVGSRFREGLAVPPDSYERRSRLSPGAAPPLAKAPAREDATQTDFPEEEYRPMTAADVGTEVASPGPRGFGTQAEGSPGADGFGYGAAAGGNGQAGDSPGQLGRSSDASEAPGFAGFGAPSPAGSARATSRASDLGDGVAGAGAGGLAVGTAAGSTTGIGAEVAAQASPVLLDATTSVSPWDPVAREGPSAAAAGVAESPAHLDATTSVGPWDPVGSRKALSAHEGGTGPDGEEARRLQAEAEAASAAAAAAAVAASAAVEPVLEDEAEGLEEEVAAEVTFLRGARAAPDAADEATVGFGAPAGGDAEVAAVAGGFSHGAFGLEEEAEGDGEAEAEGGDTFGMDDDEAAAAAAARGVTAAALAVTAGGAAARPPPSMLPAEVAAALTGPALRARGSGACQRDMSSALDICAAALAAVQKSLESYNTLLQVESSSPPSASADASAAANGGGDAASAAVSAAGGAGGPRASPTLCGKARSLQDAMQTLLAHVTLLLGDVYVYGEAPAQGGRISTPGGRVSTSNGRLSTAGTPGATGAPAGASADGAGTPGATPGAPTRDFQAEATVLLELARSHEGRLATLVEQATSAIKLPSASASTSAPDAASATEAGTAPAAAGAEAAATPSKGAAAGPAPRPHLTDEERKLCTTTLLDGHLKAVGMAQFALAQGVHRELAALTTTFFRTNAAQAQADGAAGRKARVFKLGEFQLKQLRNGDVYKGRYVGNKKNGEGVYHFINADVFEGEFRDDRMDGYGVYTFSHEGRFEGQWRNAVYNGTGAETFAKGSTYRGEYAGGLRNGWGVCRFYNGDYYEGQWAKGLRDGCGMQQCTDDSNFVGDYAKGKRHGWGVYSFPNGDRYEGQYAEDLPHGHGTYYFAGGQCYQGQWQQGKKHGWSVYTVDNGSRFMGLWSEGKPTWVQPLKAEAPTAPGAGAAQAGGDAQADDEGQQLTQALEARDAANKAAELARARAAAHWDMAGAVQSSVRSALGRAHTSASQAQQARRKACELASRLDSAVSLLQAQGGPAAVPVSASPGTPAPPSATP
ncbi:hypothetical protein HYH03_008029 [Edaphochlamys debaryana]|uniref:Calponin-homology (CH) domain-containing protein n=1 Tax=Edaphochlamys debaryana TaxID=47281 RepID=A0A836BYQ0_9CHLO|nr:hypothetical protein HYH03_008029 [Edaphochlamys debaryana]|eukprot:KAG2493810.1 hypothetical protein HYH03_008029 [Edaphochlamys debaryana]